MSDKRERHRALPFGEALFNAAADGILLMDRNRTIVAVNPAFEKMTGWKPEEVVGKTDCHTLLHCQDGKGALICDHPEHCPGLAALRRSERTLYAELTITTKEGNPLPVNASYAPVFTDGREPTYTLAIYRDMTEQKRLRTRLQRLAVTDELTGLYTRRYFYQRFAEEIKRAERHRHPLSLILTDVDALKACNDRYGHLEGDSLLVLIGKGLRAAFRRTDVRARYGGDEFIVLLPETDKPQALAAAEKLRLKIETLCLRPEGHEPYYPTISIGVATFPEDAREPADLLMSADRALYQAKQDGRNRVAA